PSAPSSSGFLPGSGDRLRSAAARLYESPSPPTPGGTKPEHGGHLAPSIGGEGPLERLRRKASRFGVSGRIPQRVLSNSRRAHGSPAGARARTAGYTTSARRVTWIGQRPAAAAADQVDDSGRERHGQHDP